MVSVDLDGAGLDGADPDGVDPDGLPPAPPTLPGSLLSDESWLSARVDQLGRQSGCRERRTNATLWWYSASAVLLAPAVRELLTTGTGVSLAPEASRFTLRFNGYLERVVPGPALKDDGAPALGRHLDFALGQVIAPLARTGRATERSLWAIAVDSLATVVLAASNAMPGGVAEAPGIAAAIATGSERLRPRPRFVDIDPDQGRQTAPTTPTAPTAPLRRYVRRGSCCLLLRVPEGKCITCPNQTPAERLERLVQHARAIGGLDR
jgi:ferric iron reductase protein FhuF